MNFRELTQSVQKLFFMQRTIADVNDCHSGGNILHMEWVRDPYSDLFFSYYTSMTSRAPALLFSILVSDDTSVFIEGTSHIYLTRIEN